MKTKLIKCKGCPKMFKPNAYAQKFHNFKCRNKYYQEVNKDEIKKKVHLKYLKNKEHILKKTREWKEKNPEKVRRIQKKSWKKYIENNRAHYNELCRGYYRKNYDKCISRSRVHHLVRNKYGYGKKIHKLNKSCFICDSRYKTWLFFDIYPLTIENMLKAVKQNKIRYLCRKHWREASKKRRLRYERKRKREEKKELSSRGKK